MILDACFYLPWLSHITLSFREMCRTLTSNTNVIANLFLPSILSVFGQLRSLSVGTWCNSKQKLLKLCV